MQGLPLSSGGLMLAAAASSHMKNLLDQVQGAFLGTALDIP